jgi:hypothetical protein
MFVDGMTLCKVGVFRQNDFRKDVCRQTDDRQEVCKQNLTLHAITVD